MVDHRRRGSTWIAAGLVVGALGLTGLLSDNTDASSMPESQPAAPPTSSASPSTGSSNAPAGGASTDAALAKLNGLAIKGRTSKTGYDRNLFGTAWTDDVMVADGHNGCDTRNDILRRNLVGITLKPGTHECVVLTGTLNDPYTGATVVFQRGLSTSHEVQIDHVVALSDAWQKGAQQWDEEQRRDFANDPLNLQATEGSVNEQKRDGDAATWLPPNKAYRCTYVSRIIDVKAAYGLWVTQAEHDAIARNLSNCATPPADTPAQPPPATSTYFPNCMDARTAGAAPLFAGDPGYRGGLDGDNDGVACES